MYAIYCMVIYIHCYICQWIPYTQKFLQYVKFADFTVTYRYSEDLANL